MRHYSRLLLIPALCLACFQAAAQSLPDDRWEISGAYFKPDISLSARADLRGSDGEQVGQFADRTSGDSGFRGGLFEATYRPTQRQRIVAGWYGVGRDRSQAYSGQGTYTPDGGDPINYQYEGRANLDTQFELYRLSYGYDFVQTPRFTATALAGVYGARLQAKANNSGTATVDGIDYDLDGQAGFDETRHAPGIGLSMAWRPADRWDVRVGAQGFRTSWGDFDTDGHFVHANAQVGYRFSKHWTAFAGYDWFELELEDDGAQSQTIDGTSYQVNGKVSGRLRVHGPAVGLRAHF